MGLVGRLGCLEARKRRLFQHLAKTARILMLSGSGGSLGGCLGTLLGRLGGCLGCLDASLGGLGIFWGELGTLLGRLEPSGAISTRLGASLEQIISQSPSAPL